MEEDIVVSETGIEVTGTINGKVVEEQVASGKSVKMGDFVEVINTGDSGYIDLTMEKPWDAILIDNDHMICAYIIEKYAYVALFTKKDGVWSKTGSEYKSYFSNSFKMIKICRLSETSIIVASVENSTGSSDGIRYALYRFRNNTLSQMYAVTKEYRDVSRLYIDRVSDSLFVSFIDTYSGSTTTLYYTHVLVHSIEDSATSIVERSFTEISRSSSLIRWNAISKIDEFSWFFLQVRKVDELQQIANLYRVAFNGYIPMITDFPCLSPENYSSISSSGKFFFVSDSEYILAVGTGIYRVQIDEAALQHSCELVFRKTYAYENFFMGEFLVCCDYKFVETYSMNSFELVDSMNLPHSLSSVSFDYYRPICGQTSSSSFCAINLYEKYTLPVTLEEDGKLSTQSVLKAVQPATSSKFMYGVALENGDSGETIKIAIPNIKENS